MPIKDPLRGSEIRRYMKKIDRSSYFFSPIVGSNPGNILRLVGQHFFQPIYYKYWLKLPLVFLTSLFFAPFNWYESLRHGQKIRETEIDTPIFIIGHWRSGTTHMHNLFDQDPQFGCTTMVQTLFPHSFLTNPLVKGVMRSMIPSTRPMDNMALSMVTPQEEELALANVSPYSFMNTWMYPKRIWQDYLRYVRLQGLSPSQKARWKKKFIRIIQKAAYSQGKSQLVLKNPAHTGRLDTLLEMWPNARFIFLHRDPVTVFFSTRRLYDAAGPALHVQKMTPEMRDEGILSIYEDIVGDYLAKRNQVPAENLIEIAYTDLEKRPLKIMEEIYGSLRIEGWEEARPRIEAYLGTIKNYKKNVHQYSEDEVNRVRERWNFAFEAFGYPETKK